MKMLLTAAALAFASPVAAQTAPPAGHAGNAPTGQTGNPSANPHAGHHMSHAAIMEHCRKQPESAGCRAMMEAHAKAKTAADAADPHAGHKADPK